MRREFCSNCGSPLFTRYVRPAIAPELVGLWAGSLDDPSWYKPTVDLWTASAQAWDPLDPTLVDCAKNPTAEQLQAWLNPR